LCVYLKNVKKLLNFKILRFLQSDVITICRRQNSKYLSVLTQQLNVSVKSSKYLFVRTNK